MSQRYRNVLALDMHSLALPSTKLRRPRKETVSGDNWELQETTGSLGMLDWDSVAIFMPRKLDK